MLDNWRVLAPGDEFTLPTVERETGQCTIYKVSDISNGTVLYRTVTGPLRYEECSLGWLIDNGLDLF